MVRGKSIKEYSFYSIAGKMFKVNTQEEGNELIFDTKKFPKGVYFLKLWTDTEVMIKKILKK